MANMTLELGFLSWYNDQSNFLKPASVVFCGHKAEFHHINTNIMLKNHTMKMYVDVEVHLHTFLILALRWR